MEFCWLTGIIKVEGKMAGSYIILLSRALKRKDPNCLVHSWWPRPDLDSPNRTYHIKQRFFFFFLSRCCRGSLLLRAAGPHPTPLRGKKKSFLNNVSSFFSLFSFRSFCDFLSHCPLCFGVERWNCQSRTKGPNILVGRCITAALPKIWSSGNKAHRPRRLHFSSVSSF